MVWSGEWSWFNFLRSFASCVLYFEYMFFLKCFDVGCSLFYYNTNDKSSFHWLNLNLKAVLEIASMRYYYNNNQLLSQYILDINVYNNSFFWIKRSTEQIFFLFSLWIFYLCFYRPTVASILLISFNQINHV